MKLIGEMIESENHADNVQIFSPKLSIAATQIFEKFSEAERKKIIKADVLEYSSAMQKLSEIGQHAPPQDIELAIIIAGVEKGKIPEASIITLLNNIHVSWKGLDKRWIKNLRVVVQSILSSSKRQLAKGVERNVINEDSFLSMCRYAQKSFEGANASHPTIFRRGHWMAEVLTDNAKFQISEVNQSRFGALLNNVAPFRKSIQTGDAKLYQGVSVPHDVLGQLYNAKQIELPVLDGVVGIPIFGKDGSLIQGNGYHASERLYLYYSSNLSIPEISKFVSDEELAEAKSVLIDDVLGDFYLDGFDRDRLIKSALDAHPQETPPPSLLNAIGLMIEQFVRPIIDGPLMPTLISKTVRGAGGGLLSNVIQTIVQGRASSQPLASNEDEKRKTVLSVVMQGDPVISFDNIVGELSSPVLATLFTEPVFTDRGLGGNVMRSVAVRSSFTLVGNRPLLSDELRRRMSLVQLKPDTANPEKRSEFKHTKLLPWVSDNRGKIIWAILVLVQNWIQKGALTPAYAPHIGSYESYVDVVGGIIEAADPNWTSWQSNRSELDQIASDDEETDIINLLSTWLHSGGSPMEAPEICTLARSNEVSLPIKRVPNGGEFEYNTRSLGKYLGGFSGRIFNLDGIEYELAKSKSRGPSAFPWILKKKESQLNVQPKQKRKQRSLLKPLDSNKNSETLMPSGSKRKQRASCSNAKALLEAAEKAKNNPMSNPFLH